MHYLAKHSPLRRPAPSVPPEMFFLWEWPLERVRALHRAAKRSGFFRDPYSMIALRHVLETREGAGQSGGRT